MRHTYIAAELSSESLAHSSCYVNLDELIQQCIVAGVYLFRCSKARVQPGKDMDKTKALQMKTNDRYKIVNIKQ